MTKYLEHTRQQYQLLAEELKLSYDLIEPTRLGIVIGKLPKISGIINGRKVVINSKIVSTKDTDLITKSLLEVDCKFPKDTNLTIHRQGLGNAIKVLLGMQDLQFEDKGFDDNFVIKSSNEEFARRVLTPEIRNLFVRDMGLLSGFNIGPSFWSIRLGNNPLGSSKKEDLDDILDFPLEEEDHSQLNQKNFQTSTSLNGKIRSYFYHNVDNEMRRGWITRVIKTNLVFAEQIEKVAMELDLYY